MIKDITESHVFSLLKPRDPDSHKGTYGMLTCVCGSRNFPGAASLAVNAALRSGAGIVRLASTPFVCSITAAKVSEPIFLHLDEGKNGSIDGFSAMKNREFNTALTTSDACLVGCGLTKANGLFDFVTHIIHTAKCRLVIDADALNLLSESMVLDKILQSAEKVPILTPHAGEMSRLCGRSIAEIKAEPERTAAEFAEKLNSVVVLKDQVTCIASPDGRVMRNTSGNAGLARGGSGDTLAGIIAAFSTQGIDAFDAACCAVWLHGASADRCAKRMSQYGMLPSDILYDLCELFCAHGL